MVLKVHRRINNIGRKIGFSTDTKFFLKAELSSNESIDLSAYRQLSLRFLLNYILNLLLFSYCITQNIYILLELPKKEKHLQ